MAVWAGDVITRRVLELILNDVRENTWLLDDILSDFVEDDILKIYGQQEIEAAREWFKNNKVDIYNQHRIDKEQMPCITVSISGDEEDRGLATLGDAHVDIKDLTPEEINKPIPYVIKPFEYTSYDQPSGFFTVPEGITMAIINPGMVAVDPATGKGFVIKEKENDGFFIAEGSEFTSTKVGILPQYRIYKARRERAIFQQRINIGCHVHGDPATLNWLHSVVMYGLLRYREGMLESRGFQLSNIKNSDFLRNDAFQSYGENVFSKFIVLTGQVQHTWIKSPRRVIETTNLIGNDGNVVNQLDGEKSVSGITFISEDGKQVPDIVEEECTLWVSKDSDE